jgi:hypothetical protein
MLSLERMLGTNPGFQISHVDAIPEYVYDFQGINADVLIDQRSSVLRPCYLPRL